LDFASREDRDVRRQHTLGAARHDEEHALRDLVLTHAETRREQRLVRHRRVAAAPIVDAAVAFGLPEHAHDVARIDRPLLDQRVDSCDVVGRTSWNALNVYTMHELFLLACAYRARRRLLKR